jgi:hypothetical protein
MTKEKWMEHIEQSGTVTRPSKGGNKADWQELITYHKSLGCALCADRAKTRKATQNRKNRDDVMRSCGLTKVFGAVSGRVYWE